MTAQVPVVAERGGEARGRLAVADREQPVEDVAQVVELQVERGAGFVLSVAAQRADRTVARVGGSTRSGARGSSPARRRRAAGRALRRAPCRASGGDRARVPLGTRARRPRAPPVPSRLPRPRFHHSLLRLRRARPNPAANTPARRNKIRASVLSCSWLKANVVRSDAARLGGPSIARARSRMTDGATVPLRPATNSIASGLPPTRRVSSPIAASAPGVRLAVARRAPGTAVPRRWRSTRRRWRRRAASPSDRARRSVLRARAARATS